MADLDLQSLGMRLGEAITPTPRDAPQVRYGTIDAVNADGTLDVAIDGTTLRGMCATTGCVGAQAGMRCLVLRQGPLATVVGLIASADLSDIEARSVVATGDVVISGHPIIDSGSNANGQWLKFADGTMVAWVNVTMRNIAFNAYAGGWYLGSYTWTFPVAFTAAPVVACGQFKWGSGASIPLSRGATTTTATLSGMDAVARASGTPVDISAVAVGRWR